MPLIKICPDCQRLNNISDLDCVQCGKSLAGVSMKSSTQGTSTSNRPQPAVLPGNIAKGSVLGGQQGQVPRPPLKKSFWRKNLRSKLMIIALVLIVVTTSVIFALRQRGVGIFNPVPPAPVIALHLPNGLGVASTAPGQYVGVNDGSFAPFDIGRDPQEMAFKQQAATQLKQGNVQAAISLWSQALKIESNDAEALIYIEDQRVLAARKPYVTLIAGTSFTPPFKDNQYEDELQGIYVAQHEFNQAGYAFQVHVLIANLGSSTNTEDTAPVIQQITQVATKDTTVVGIIGWLNSSTTLNALSAVSKFKGVKIPIISPQASSDHLTGISPYFFRVVGPNKGQAQAAAQFMQSHLGVKHPVVFVDPEDQYSQNLAQDFEGEFAAAGKLPEVNFKTDSTKDFAPLIQKALKDHPETDAFYFTSPSSVDAGLFQAALPTTDQYATIPAMGGDGGYSIQKNGYGRWYFTEYAYHGANKLPVAIQFAQDYIADFDPGPHLQKPLGYYGYSLAKDHAILAYDATSVMLVALQTAYGNGHTTLTPQVLADALPNITGVNAFQGVSGQIAFGADGDPINKAIVILLASKDGHTQLYNIQGCLVKGCP